MTEEVYYLYDQPPVTYIAPQPIVKPANKGVQDWLKTFFLNERWSCFANIIINFSIGFILGPTSFGLVYYMAFVLLYEIFLMYLDKGIGPYANPFFRAGYIFAGLAGYIFGRTVGFAYNLDPLAPIGISDLSFQAADGNISDEQRRANAARTA